MNEKQFKKLLTTIKVSAGIIISAIYIVGFLFLDLPQYYLFIMPPFSIAVVYLWCLVFDFDF